MLEALKENGWAETSGPLCNFDEILLSIGKNLGRPISARGGIGLVQQLSPLDKANGYPRSLTSKFGMSSFPFHSDTSHWLTPCRYIILGCISPGAGHRTTELARLDKLDLTSSEIKFLHNHPFRVINGSKSFFSSILGHNRPFIRYDPGCMQSASCRTDLSNEILSPQRLENISEQISWFAGKIIVIDNWRALHRRSFSATNDKDRTLKRVLVI